MSADRKTITRQWRPEPGESMKASPLDDYVEVKVDLAPAIKTVDAPSEAAAPAGPPDGLQTCLDCWKAFMYGDADRDLGAKSMSGLVGNDDGYGVDASEAQQARDMRIGAATDAMIDSMKRIHIWAIYTICSQATPWNYPNADILVIGPVAMEELEKKLKINIATSILF